ncbi:cardiolipin synthase [Plantibacter flavus]|uniref:cardiolipin synthase n=1 Tax=Plantibacter flavus TaxID=150123 RepID=UPI003F16029B
METTETVALLLIGAHIVLGFVATVLVAANRCPSAAIAWVLTIVFIPFVGALAYFLVGRDRLPAARVRQQHEVNAAMLARTDGPWLLSHSEEWPAWLHTTVRLNTTLGALPMVGGNRASLIADYRESFDRMIEVIDSATTTVHVEFYILVLDDSTRPFFDALARACARGVVVRVLFDHVASFLSPNRAQTAEALRAMGASAEAMLPLRPFRGQWQRPDLRNHRKIVVVDGRIGFTGSQNLIDESYLKPANIARGLRWLELMVELEGPVVRELDAVFITDWYAETGVLLPLDTSAVLPGSDPELLDAQVLPSGPSFDADNNLKLFTALIHKADRRVSIASPYFVPDESLLLAMTTAAARGLQVELFVSELGDQKLVHHAQRSYYESLLRAGVAIYQYRPPVVLHAKHFTIDDDVAVIGSSNMDIRSFSLNMEASVLVHGAAFVTRMRAVEDDYKAASTRLHLDDWQRRPLSAKVLDNLARLTSSLQ